MFRVVGLLTVTTLLNAAPSVRKWHDAEVVSVKSIATVRTYEIIDSYDPRCRLTYREFWNPIRPLAISEGTKVRIAAGSGPTIYLIDKRGRTHKGTLLMQVLMPPPHPPLADKTP